MNLKIYLNGSIIEINNIDKLHIKHFIDKYKHPGHEKINFLGYSIIKNKINAIYLFDKNGPLNIYDFIS